MMDPGSFEELDLWHRPYETGFAIEVRSGVGGRVVSRVRADGSPSGNRLGAGCRGDGRYGGHGTRKKSQHDAWRMP